MLFESPLNLTLKDADITSRFTVKPIYNRD